MPIPTDLRRITLPSGHRLSLRRGDLTEEDSDAIVNAANTALMHGGGLAGAIVRRGGASIQIESLKIGRVKTGGAAATNAGKLAAKRVIHAVGPIWKTRPPEENDKLLASATAASLEVARVECLQSIAFPALASGIFGFPKDRCAHVMLNAVEAWAEANPDALPGDIRFTLYDDPTVAAFLRDWERRYGTDGG